MTQQFWILKSEPTAYSFDDLLKDKKTLWNGVRNFEARNNLRRMKIGDMAFFYHSNIGKEIVGIVTISKEAFADSTAPNEDWSVVEVEPVAKVHQTLSLEHIKKDENLKNIALIKKSRLSVIPIDSNEFKHILKVSGTSLNKP